MPAVNEFRVPVSSVTVVAVFRNAFIFGGLGLCLSHTSRSGRNARFLLSIYYYS
jgi:hypothetical protein